MYIDTYHQVTITSHRGEYEIYDFAFLFKKLKIKNNLVLFFLKTNDLFKIIKHVSTISGEFI